MKRSDTKPVILLGAGGHARVLLNVLALQSRSVSGMTSVDKSTWGTLISGTKIIGDDESVLGLKRDEVELVNALGSVKTLSARKAIFEKFKTLGFYFCQVIHPQVVMANDVKLAEGVHVMAGAVLQTGVSVEENSIINTGAIVDHDCSIGKHTHIAPGVVLSGSVSVGDNVHIGTGARVIQGIRIGSGALIAAGAVVVKDVAEGATVMGVPARER